MSIFGFLLGDIRCCCLTLLPLIIGWDIVGYESDTLPYYNELTNRSYYIMLNYTDYPSTPWVHLPRPSPTTSSFR